MYRDGPAGRYLLDGTWYRRADPGDQGDKPATRAPRASPVGSDYVPVAVNAGDFSVQSSWASSTGTARTSRCPRSGGRRVGLPLRVGQLPREGLAEREADRQPRRRLPAVRAAREGHPARQASTGSSCASTAAGRSSTSRRSRYGATAFEGGWWNYNGILREVYLRRVDHARLRRACSSARASLPSCAATDHDRRDVSRTSPRTAAGRDIARHVRRPRAALQAAPGRRAAATAASRPSVRIAKPAPVGARQARPSTGSGSLLHRPGRRRSCSATRSTPASGASRSTGSAGSSSTAGEVNLRGASIHEDSLSRGAALTPAQMQQNIGYLRELGATSRAQHYPLHPYELELADRYGILVWSEIPVYRMTSTLFNDRGGPAQGAADAPRGDHARPQPPVGDGLEHRKRERVAAGARPPALHPQGGAHGRSSSIPRGSSGSRPPASRPSRSRPSTPSSTCSASTTTSAGTTARAARSRTARSWAATSTGCTRTIRTRRSSITEFGAEANRNGPVTEKGTYQFQADFLKYHLGRVRLEAVHQRQR